MVEPKKLRLSIRIMKVLFIFPLAESGKLLTSCLTVGNFIPGSGALRRQVTMPKPERYVTVWFRHRSHVNR